VAHQVEFPKVLHTYTIDTTGEKSNASHSANTNMATFPRTGKRLKILSTPIQLLSTSALPRLRECLIGWFCCANDLGFWGCWPRRSYLFI